LATVANDPIPPSSWLFDPAADPAVPFSTADAEAALKKAGWTKKADGWYLPAAKAPLTIEVISPKAETNPAAWAAADAVVEDWKALGLTASHVALPASEFVMDRLRAGVFAAAVTDVNIGLDPDLYPLLASSQTQSGGSNVAGVQVLALDKLLSKARKPGTDAERKAAYSALQTELGKGRYLLPLAFQDEVMVYRDTIDGPLVRQVSDRSDRFWDVLTWRLAADR
jgi:ABC-type transport system substrate-binding protein